MAAPSERQLPGWFIAVFSIIFVIFCFFFAEFAGALLVGAYGALQHMTGAQIDTWLTNSVGAQFAYSFIADGLLVSGIYLGLRWLRWSWATIGFKRPTLLHIVIGILSAAPYFALYLVIVAIVSAIVPSLNLNQKQDIGFYSVQGVGPLVLTFLSLVVLPPLAEEIAMRGFLYTGLKRWLPWTVAGLLVSVLFGAAHLAEGGDAGPLWIGAIDTFTLSLVLVFLREKTGNLWAGIALHATKNCVAFVMLFIIGGR